MVFVNADETLMRDLFLFFICIHCHTTVFEIISFAHDFCAIEPRQALVRGKKWFGYFKDVSSKSAGCFGISHAEESVFVGRTRGIILHLSKYNYERIEPSPISIQTVPFKSVASMFQVKRSRTYATISLKILCVSFPGPAVLFSTTARRAGTHQEPRNRCFWKTVPLSPPPSPDKEKVLNSSCFIWGLSSSQHICIFTVWGFYLIDFIRFLNFSWW